MYIQVRTYVGNYYSNRWSNRSTKKCGRSNASIYAGVGATTFFKIRLGTSEKATSRSFASFNVYKKATVYRTEHV